MHSTHIMKHNSVPNVHVIFFICLKAENFNMKSFFMELKGDNKIVMQPL